MQSRKLDALRGVASLIVLLAHACQVFIWRLYGPESPLAVLTGNLARHAVLVFFLLSGYLITSSIRANIARNGRFVVADYAVARIARIYPPLVGSIAVVIVVCSIIHGLSLPGSFSYWQSGDLYQARAVVNYRWFDIVAALLMSDSFQQANGPLWSLFIEVKLYIVAALVALGLRSRLWAVVAAVVFLYLYVKVVDFALFAGAWGMGAGVALWGRHMTRAHWLAWPLGALLLAAAIWRPAMLGMESDLAQGLFCLLYAYLIFLCPIGQNPPRWMVASADYSYSLYVIHFPLLMLALSVTQPMLGGLAISLAVAGIAAALCIVAAYYFARYFENQANFKPAIRQALSGALPATQPDLPAASPAAESPPPARP